MSIAECAPPARRSSDRCTNGLPDPLSFLTERRLRDVSPLVVDGGCDVRLRGSDHTEDVRVALLEWLPIAWTELVVYESGLFRDDPARSLALLVRPPTIWSIREAVIATRLHCRAGRFEPEQFAALVRHAGSRLGSVHLARLRDVAARIGRQVPVEGLPCASATVVAGCAAISSDDEARASIAAM